MRRDASLKAATIKVVFQSQMRSRSTCDRRCLARLTKRSKGLVCEASSRNASRWVVVNTSRVLVSISDEKPLHVRHMALPHLGVPAGYYTRKLIYLQVAVKDVEAFVLRSEAACMA